MKTLKFRVCMTPVMIVGVSIIIVNVVTSRLIQCLQDFEWWLRYRFNQ